MKLFIKVNGHTEKGFIVIESSDTVKSVNRKVLEYYKNFKVNHGGDKVPPANADFLGVVWLKEMTFSTEESFFEVKSFPDKASFSIFIKDCIKLSFTEDDAFKLSLLRGYTPKQVSEMVVIYNQHLGMEKRIGETMRKIHGFDGWL